MMQIPKQVAVVPTLLRKEHNTAHTRTHIVFHKQLELVQGMDERIALQILSDRAVVGVELVLVSFHA